MESEKLFTPSYLYRGLPWKAFYAKLLDFTYKITT